SRVLLMRSVDGRGRVLIQAGVFDVADNADNCSPRADSNRRLHPKPLPDRVFIGPVPARHGLVDYPDWCGFLAIPFSEDSPSLQWDTNSAKEIPGHNPIIYSSQRRVRWLSSFNKEGPGKFAAAKRQSVNGARRFHSWERIELFCKLLIKSGPLR